MNKICEYCHFSPSANIASDGPGGLVYILYCLVSKHDGSRHRFHVCKNFKKMIR